MPAVKSIPIRDPESGSAIGQYFEASSSFQASIGKNYVEMQNADGRKIQANRKLISHYTDKGYEVVTSKKSKDAN